MKCRKGPLDDVKTGARPVQHFPSRKREEFQQAREQVLADIAVAVQRKRLSGEANIERRIGERANRYKVRNHQGSSASPSDLHLQRGALAGPCPLAAAVLLR